MGAVLAGGTIVAVAAGGSISPIVRVAARPFGVVGEGAVRLVDVVVAGDELEPFQSLVSPLFQLV